MNLEQLAQWAKSEPNLIMRIKSSTFREAKGIRSEEDALHILTQVSGRKWEWDRKGDLVSFPNQQRVTQ